MPIELFVDYHRFFFRKDEKNLGFALFDNLELTHAPRLPREDIDEMKWMLADFQMGEVMTGTLVKGKVLGPERPFELEVTLRACGNPDHQQYADVAPKKVVRICNTEEAIAATMDYQTNYNMGQGNIAPTHGKVWRMAEQPGGRRKHIGFVTFGGRYETIAERKASDKLSKEKYQTKQTT